MDFLTSLQRTSRRLTDTVSNTLDDLLDDNENKRQQPVPGDALKLGCIA